MSSSKKIVLLRDFAAGVIVWGHLSYDPDPPPPYTLYTCILYTNSYWKGGEGARIEPEKRLEGQQFTSWV